MQDLKDKLTVLHTTDGSTFTSLTSEAFSLLAGTFTVSHTVYVGFRKPFRSVFISVPTNTNAGTWTVSYYNGAWTQLDALFDSPSLTASGFIRWEEPTDANDENDEVETTVNGTDLFWYKLQHSTTSSVSLQGVGPLLCSASDLRELDFNLDETDANILKAMASARNRMVKELQISAWDLLNIAEVSEAAAHLALYFIYYNASDRPDDHQRIVAQDHLETYKILKAQIPLTVDTNDNGKEDSGEKQVSRSVSFVR